jgi:hypothetical protein
LSEFLRESPAPTPEFSSSRGISRQARHKALLAAVAALFIAILVEYVSILSLNSGHLVYTLDDAYIHLKLAQTIMDGHYGLNKNEFSAPASSIIWPFILAPLSHTDFGEYFPFFINTGCALVTLFLFYKILVRSVFRECQSANALWIFLVLLILATNLIGLVFTGMEHSLQLLLAVAVLWGLILEVEEGRVSPWLIVGVVAGPLVRYENCAISAGALIYLLLRRHRKVSLIMLSILIASLGSFSFLLLRSGLKAVPTSVFAKSAVISSGVSADTIWTHLLYSVSIQTGAILLIAALCLLSFGLLSKQTRAIRLLSLAISFSIGVHLLAGQYGWYHRYEIYIFSLAVLTLIYIFGHLIAQGLQTSAVATICIAILFVTLTCPFYILDLKTLPVAANNIYEQHYQMHRFATEYCRCPVAVNDVGYVSYRNPNYVLDLLGLASLQAYDLRMKRQGSDWMDELCRKEHVQLAMIYSNLFPQIPRNWTKIAELRLGKKRITPFNQTVSFYAVGQNNAPRLIKLLVAFRSTLPEGCKLDIL